MTEPRGLYSKLSREGMFVVVVLWVVFDFAGKVGLAPRQQMVAQLDPASGQALADLGSANNRLLTDLHQGLAPRDFNLVPHWSALRSSLEKQTQAIQESTRAIEILTTANKRLSYQMDRDAGVVPNREARAASTLWQRLVKWWGA